MKSIENTYYFFSIDKFEPRAFFKNLFSDKRKENVVTTSDDSSNGKIKININNQIFNYEYNKKIYHWECFVKKMNTDKTVYEIKINFFYKDKKEKAAEAFSQLIQTIKQHKKNQFNMVPIKDSLSIYFSQKSFSSLAMYEHSLRALILAIFVPIYKDSWPQKLNASVGEKLSIKGNAKDKLEKTLEELDLSDLENIFFESHLAINNKNYNEKFNINNLDELTQEDLVEMIKYNQPLSLWEQQISKYADIKNLKETMANIRNLRNRIAHNKTFSYKNYTQLKTDLNYMSNKINEATEKILKNLDNNITFETLISIGKSYSDMVSNLNTSFSEVAKEVSKSLYGVGKLIQVSVPLKELAKATSIIVASVPDWYLNDKKYLPTSLFSPNEEGDDEEKEDELIDNET